MFTKIISISLLLFLTSCSFFSKPPEPFENTFSTYHCNNQSFDRSFTLFALGIYPWTDCPSPLSLQDSDRFIRALNTAISTSPQREKYLELAYMVPTLSPDSARILAEMDVDTIAGLSHVSDPEILRILLKTGKPKLYEPVSLPFYSDEVVKKCTFSEGIDTECLIEVSRK